MKSLFKRFLYGGIPYFYLKLFKPQSDNIQYYKYIKDHAYTKLYTRFPTCYFAHDYLKQEVTVHQDPLKGLPYVEHNKKRLYFPKSIPPREIADMYIALLIEQHVECPHCYVQSLEEYRNKTLLDVGSAEGIISLDAIDYAKFIYLFEFDEEWIEALEATFEPWKDKVQIIAKYVSNTIDDIHETLDNFLKDKSKDDLFLKMDIEGEERNALEGARELFEQSPDLEFAICTYHKKDDLQVISSFLDTYHCNYKSTKGYMYLKHQLRTCLVRGNKG